jgi:CheY-like chemotaxis protein
MRKILVVDDQPHMLRFLRFLLERAGYQSLQARSRSEALRLIEEEHPDLLLVNGESSQENSVADLDLLRKEGSRLIPMIIMSARPPARGSCQGEADVVLSKPFSPSKLMGDIRRLVA